MQTNRVRAAGMRGSCVGYRAIDNSREDDAQALEDCGQWKSRHTTLITSGIRALDALACVLGTLACIVLMAPDIAIATETSARLRTWEMPAVTVEGASVPVIKEEELVGPYHQPRWTTTRRFLTTRAYVVPEGKIETELWMRYTIPKHGETDEYRTLQELEIGLPHRFQLDLYARQDFESHGDNFLWGGQFEVRYALADWGKIWGNPTLYFEYAPLENRPNVIEPKLLLSDDLAPRWHGALNLVAEMELSGEETHEYQITGGLSYTVIDSKFDVGVENKYVFADKKGDRGNFTHENLIGPSFQYRPVQNMTINFVPLVGVTHDSPKAQIFLNAGWEF
jgi:hypothetical protein